LLACHGSETTFDIFLVYTNEEVTTHSLVKMEDEGEEEEKKSEFTPADFFAPLESRTTNDKIKSIAFDDLSPSRHVIVATGSNSVQIYKVCVGSEGRGGRREWEWGGRESERQLWKREFFYFFVTLSPTQLGVHSRDLLEEQKNSTTPSAESKLSAKLDFEGHPADIRFVALSYDDAQILSVSTSIYLSFTPLSLAL
jgi:hypothetical protein